MKEKNWRKDISEHLANLHCVQIIEGIIKPSVEQVIDDLEDSLTLFDETDDGVQIKLTNNLIKFWKSIKKQIKEEALVK